MTQCLLLIVGKKRWLIGEKKPAMDWLRCIKTNLEYWLYWSYRCQKLPYIHSNTYSKTGQYHDEWSDISEKVTDFVSTPICICGCICVCICACISDWLRRKTCWLLRPHQDQSRVAPPAKSWKPRSLSTAPTPDQTQPTTLLPRRGALDAIFAKHGIFTRTPDIFTRTHLHGRRHLRLYGELH